MIWDIIEIEKTFILFGSSFFIAFCLLEILKKEKSVLSYFLILLSLNLFLIHYRFYLYLYLYSVENPELFFSILFNISLVGPFVLSISKQLMDFALPANRFPLFIHYLPAIPVLFGEIYFHANGYLLKKQAFQDSYEQLSFDFIHLGVSFTIFQLLIYLIFFVWNLIKIDRAYKLQYSKPMFILLGFAFTILGLLGIGFFLKKIIFFRFGLYVFSILGFVLLFFREKFPGFFQAFQQEIQTVRYERTQLNGINLEAIHKRLQELMEEKKLFLNEELRLSMLAEELLISPNQLSRILNEHYTKNFNEFINFYRIEESKKILLDDLEKTILSVAFEVGFNSKATFNSQFVKFTGLTPSEYRKKFKD